MRRLPIALPTLLLALPACSGAQDGTVPSPPCPTAPPSASTAVTPPPASPPPASIAAADSAVVTLTSRDAIPLTGPRVDGKAGDLMVQNGQAAAVVTQEGRLVDFGLAGARDEIVWLNPTVAIGLSNLDTPVVKVSAEAGDKAIRLERAVAGKPLTLVTWVYLKGAELHVETVAESTGDDPALAVTLGERVGWGNVPTWVDGHGFVKDAGKLTGGFLARDALGVAYALCSETGPLFAKIEDQEYAGLFETARTGESVVLVPARGRSPSRSIVVTASTTSLGHAVMALPCGLGKGPASAPATGAATPPGTATPSAPAAATPARVKLPALDIPAPRARLEVVRCADSGNPGKPFFVVRGSAPEGSPAALLTRLAPIELPAGCFRARLVAPGHAAGPWVEPERLTGAVPADLSPRAGTLAFSVTEGGSPVPARLVVRGEPGTPDPDWGDDADGTGAASNVAATSTGSGELPLPAGKYRVLVNRGFEYTAHEEKIEIRPGKATSVKVKLDRAMDTKGWVAADLHLHAVPSSDAPSLLTDRIRSLVAAGVEVAVATDHNAITDYRPAIAELGVQRHIRSVVGDEITTRDVPWGHFNAFPLDPAMEPIPYKGVTPSSLFASVRAAKPYGKDTLLQVNHPRMGGIGYFELLRFDPLDIPAWLARSPLADMGFDALEVFNGDHYTRLHKVEECLSDWYALLNAGHRFTATGNSDSHRVGFHEPGVPRSYVFLGADDPAKVDERAFVDAVRAGRVTVSSGPFVTLRSGDKAIGDSIAEGEAELAVTVDAPPWVDIDEVTLLKRGAPLKSWKIEKKAGKRPWTFTTRQPLKKGDWVIALARGQKPMTYLYRSGAQPFGFTNPIFVK